MLSHSKKVGPELGQHGIFKIINVHSHMLAFGDPADHAWIVWVHLEPSTDQLFQEFLIEW